jgi:hypothetical protein
MLEEVLSLSGNAIAAYSAEILNILRSSFRDTYHEINVQACMCMAQLASRLERRLQPASKELIAAALPLTTHRRKAVRCAALHAVKHLVLCGGHEMILQMVAWRDPNVVAVKAFYEPDPKACNTIAECRKRAGLL